MSEASAILALAHRDFIKLLRDRQRIVADFAFPLIFIGILGTTLQAGFGERAGINLMDYVFTGVLAQTVWQSSAMGLISLPGGPRAGFQPGDLRLTDLALLDHRGENTGRIARDVAAGARHSHLRVHPADPHVARPALAHGARAGGRRAVRRRVRRDRARESVQPARREPDLPLRVAAAVLPGRDLQPDPEPAAPPGHPFEDRADALRGGPHAGRVLRRSAVIAASSAL